MEDVHEFLAWDLEGIESVVEMVRHVDYVEG